MREQINFRQGDVDYEAIVIGEYEEQEQGPSFFYIDRIESVNPPLDITIKRLEDIYDDQRVFEARAF